MEIVTIKIYTEDEKEIFCMDFRLYDHVSKSEVDRNTLDWLKIKLTEIGLTEYLQCLTKKEVEEVDPTSFTYSFIFYCV